MTWAAENVENSGRRYAHGNGLDLPGDYDGDHWTGTPPWTRSAAESNVRILLAVDREALSERAARAWQKLDRAYELLHGVRARAIARADHQIRRGRTPKRPPGLRRAQEAERAAFLKFVKAARIDLRDSFGRV